VARPTEKTAWDALSDAAGQCRAVPAYGEPLVVDWEIHQRASLEEAMHQGVAVVAYDCKSLRLLKDCRIDGSYGFMAVSKKEQGVRFESADEVAASMPGFGLTLIHQLRGELRSDSTLDLEMILIGKERTTIREAGRDKLRGGEASCSGATHFVRGAFLGAFALGTGTRGQVSAGVGLLAAGSQSARSVRYRDGDPQSCEQVQPGSADAPASCRALLRLELAELGATAPAGDAPSAEPTCPAGLVMSGGKCTRSSDAPHQCQIPDAADCTTQCDRGHMGSCANLGYMFAEGKGVPKDKARALTLYQRSCDGGIPDSCYNLGAMVFRGDGTTRDLARAAQLFQRACEGGSAYGCYHLGRRYLLGEGVPADQVRALALFHRGCAGGLAASCEDERLLSIGRGLIPPPGERPVR
jgi:hypothetical protein